MAGSESTVTTAQVQPAAFTTGMMRAAQARGAELRLGNVTGLLCRGGDVVGVDLDGETLTGDAVVIAMGPWSAGGCVPRMHGCDWCDAHAGGVSACRWDNVCVCDLERLSAADRP